MRPCRYPGCPEVVPGGYCAGHRARAEALYRRPAQQRHLYGTKRWKQRSRAFLAAHPVCACGCGAMATVVDHVTPVEAGGAFWDEGNWQGLSKPCHDRKTLSELKAKTHAL